MTEKNNSSTKENIYRDVMNYVNDSNMIVSTKEALIIDQKGNSIIRQGYIESNIPSEKLVYYVYDPEYIEKNFLDIDLSLKIKTLNNIRTIRYWVKFWSMLFIVVGFIYIFYSLYSNITQ